LFDPGVALQERFGEHLRFEVLALAAILQEAIDRRGDIFDDSPHDGRSAALGVIRTAPDLPHALRGVA
jgi:hypothetical protein